MVRKKKFGKKNMRSVSLWSVATILAQTTIVQALAPCAKDADCAYDGCSYSMEGGSRQNYSFVCRFFDGHYGSAGNNFCLNEINGAVQFCVEPLCPAGSFSSTGVGHSFQSERFSYCPFCVPGTFSSTRGASSQNACRPCPAGKYSEDHGQVAIDDCMACGEGKYSTLPGRTSAESCSACPSHTFTRAGSSAITNCTCNVGFTGPDGGACKACVAGTYKDVHGSLPCLLCEAGKYSTESGQIEAATCQQCPADASSIAGSPTLKNCICNQGHTPRTGAAGGICEPCAPGSYKDVNGSQACTSCPESTYSSGAAQISDAMCSTCPLHSYSAEGSYAVTNCSCNVGYTGPNGQDCMACGSGRYKDVNGSASCSLCQQGKFSIGGSSACQDCSNGKFNHNVGATTCTTPKVSSVAVQPSTTDIVVQVTLGLPISEADFDASQQRAFRQGIAYTADVSIQRVRIVKIENLGSRSRLRRLLADGIKVDVEILVKDGNMAIAVKNKLTNDNINAEFEKTGLPRVEILSAAETSIQDTSDKAEVSADVIAIIVGIAAGSIALPVVLTWLMSSWRQRKLSLKSEHEKKAMTSSTRAMMLQGAPIQNHVDDHQERMVPIDFARSNRELDDARVSFQGAHPQESIAEGRELGMHFPAGRQHATATPRTGTGEPTEGARSDGRRQEDMSAEPADLILMRQMEGESSEVERLAEQQFASAWFKHNHQSPPLPENTALPARASLTERRSEDLSTLLRGPVGSPLGGWSPRAFTMHLDLGCDVVGCDGSTMRAHFQHVLQQDLSSAVKAGGLNMAWHCFVIMSLSPVSHSARGSGSGRETFKTNGEGVECVVRVVQDASGLPHPFPQYKGSNPIAVISELERQAMIPSSTLLAGNVSKNVTSLFTTNEKATKETGTILFLPASHAKTSTPPREQLEERLALLRQTRDPSRRAVTKSRQARGQQATVAADLPSSAVVQVATTPPITPPLTSTVPQQLSTPIGEEVKREEVQEDVIGIC